MKLSPIKYSLILLLALVGTFQLCGGNHTRPFIRPHSQHSGEIKATPVYRLYFIGDAGKIRDDKPENLKKKQAFKKWIATDTLPHQIIYLGDNVYEDGLPRHDDESVAGAERKALARVLEHQIQIGGERTEQIVFVPGNHDWDNANKNEKGLERIIEQARYLNGQAATSPYKAGKPATAGGLNSLSRARAHPACGCASPRVELVGDDLAMIYLDTQAMMYLFSREISPRDKAVSQAVNKCLAVCYGEKECAVKNPADFKLAMAAIRKKYPDRAFLLATHHPLKTNGPHGGYERFPHSLYRIPYYHIVRSDQDLTGSNNKKMIDLLHESLAGARPPLAVFSGHDHSLQVLAGERTVGTLVVSGTGSKVSGVTDRRDTRFALMAPGMARVTLFKNSPPLLEIITRRDPAYTKKQCRNPQKEYCVLYRQLLQTK